MEEFNINNNLSDLDNIDNLNDLDSIDNLDIGTLISEDLTLDNLQNQENNFDNNFDDFFNNFSDEQKDDFDDLFNNDLEDKFATQDKVVFKTVAFEGFYIDFLGITPNTILNYDNNKLLVILKLYFDRNKLDYLVNNISGHTYNGVRYEGFIEQLITKSVKLPEDMVHLQHRVDYFVEKFTDNWHKLLKYINSIKSNTYSFTLSKNLSNCIDSKITNSTSFLKLISDTKASETILKELCKDKNTAFLDYIIKRITLSKELSEVYRDYTMDTSGENLLNSLIYEFTSFRTNFSAEDKKVLKFLGFPESLFGNEYKIVKIDKELKVRPTEVELYERLLNNPNLVSRYLTLYDIQVINNKTFIEF